MSRLPAPALADAPEAALPLFDAIRKAAGKLPNAYALIGSLSPAALKLALEGDAALSRGALSRADIEAIRVAVSASNGCDYCVAAHTAIGKMVGLKADELRQLREGGAGAEDAKRQALVDFARHLVSTTGTVAAERVQAVLAAGWTSTQVVEAMLAISLIGFTNLVNRVNDTPIDFPIPA
ncbi:carboxymuconolactone decarboxylase family protein [Mitsuaria sp. GD03876]|uniref:carboxymuconolactone decarboxylase family protein n=1 Tax=Mitsuaria sp. GD03876 TaxID=2975399 RepID=UPI00244B4307|nr:carboxymuconolactone decarboxylase family protein [Mitsuaria sp. GD03876]MDH0863448.1 carboxymuconolactone decarboxylase family protein [Mitsuaria sp. GD03876]